ncbi:transketolase [Streptomyces endophyticus]|uniref:Transketolase n=1 Tax=Streptomyces endophyticus TaxID=714166 RepID=A0ABU6F824_9ACTN|nr:transketolase [Streptomyces endophyticus]MEB8339628.1 transketolase [Streptomyces endophyticus]
MGTSAPPDVEHLANRARFIRTETVRLTRIAGAGHYSAVFSCAEILAALYYSELRIDPSRPDWADRDRFVMSKGHAAIGLYPVLADRGYFSPSELDTYTRLGSPFGDHPDMKKIDGVDFSSGSLGHGLSVGVGMTLSGKPAGRDYRTWCLLGDGELAEGQIWEAAMSASHYGLGNLVAVVDANQLGIDGFVSDVMATEPIDRRFAAFGWDVHRVDGHDLQALLDVFAAVPARGGDRPQVIVADTVKGKGVARMELSPDWHVGNLAGADYDDVMKELTR